MIEQHHIRYMYWALIMIFVSGCACGFAIMGATFLIGELLL